MSDLRRRGDLPSTVEESGESTLLDRVARLESLLECLPVGVLVQGKNTEIRFANETARRLLGIERGSLVGRTSFDPDWDVVHEDGSPFPGKDHPVSIAAQSGVPIRDVIMGVRIPNRIERTWLLVNADPIANEEGDVDRILCTFSDVTDRRDAKLALLASESLDRKVLDAVPAGVVHVDAAGNFLKANAEARRILGIADDGLSSVAVETFAARTIREDGRPFPAEDYPATQCLSTGRRQGQSTIGLRLDNGSTMWAVYSAMPLFDAASGKLSGAVITFVDITERKQIEEHLRQVQRVEAVARLAGGVAHHFNNLLTVISGYASLMSKRLAPDDPLAEDAAEIRKAADRAAQLTRQLLAFNRRQIVERRVVDVNVVIGDMRSMLMPLFGETVRLDVDLRAVPATVWADPAQIEDIVLNLAVNARDAMPKGGSFTLSTRTEAVEGFDARHPDLHTAQYVVIEAQDAGTGIASSDIDHIFEPFFTTKEVGKGTGLGLSTIHEIVHQSGGAVEVASSPGEGSRFTVYLPVIDAATAPIAAVPGAEVRRGRETILVVEDDDGVRSYLRQSLARCGYRVLEARNGLDALAISDDYPGSIAALVTDVVMPELGGPELATKLVRARPNVRVLFITGYADGSTPVVEYDGLTASLLEKPFSLDTLTERLRSLLDSK